MTVYATRLVNGTDTMERMRRTDALGLFPSGAGTARGGFRNDGGGAVTVNAGTMTVDVSPFMAYVDGGVSDAQGGYTFVSDGTESLSVSPGHASLSRTDVVIAEVRDTVHDASGSTDARVRILEGTPGAGTPALPTNALALREVNIPAGLSAGTGGLASGNLGTDRRTYTSGLGGVVTVASQAERDALPNVKGTTVYRTDTDKVEVRRASGWHVVAGDGWQDFTLNMPNFPQTTDLARYQHVDKTCHFQVEVTCTSGFVSGFWMNLPVQAAQTSGTINATVKAEDTGTGYAIGVAFLRDANSIGFETAYPATSSWSGTIPHGWAVGDRLLIAGTYETA